VSWTIIFSKWSMFRRARNANLRFLRLFRKASRLDAVAAATEQYRAAPLVTVFDFGYSEVARQISARSRITNPVAVERTLQLGISEEITRLERSMNWLATTATVSPFIGLFGTVWGIINAFQALALTGSTSMRTVAPGIAQALIATALGLAAAIPAAVFYNQFGHTIKEMGARMEDFSLEFQNMTERNFEE
jgi:biopolymer transport protein TolQ